MTEANGNGRWRERLAMALLSIMLAGLSTWVWDIRQELTDVRRTQDKRQTAVESIPELRRVQDERSTQLTIMNEQLMALKARFDVMSQRILSLAARLDLMAQKQRRQYQPSDPENETN